KMLTHRSLILTVLPILALSLQCFNYEVPAGQTPTVPRTSVECPFTARFCISAYSLRNINGNQVYYENRGCADDIMCQQFIKKQTTECQGLGYNRQCCCMGNQCNDEIR
ncbi:hypothetical protein PFISCL1PPCAC_1094, partial [Pristionchus fissidentatus]